MGRWVSWWKGGGERVCVCYVGKEDGEAHVKPVDRFMPARMVETATRLEAATTGRRERRRTEHRIKSIVS